jgi:ABC-type transport system substrate-binding protein
LDKDSVDQAAVFIFSRSCEKAGFGDRISNIKGVISMKIKFLAAFAAILILMTLLTACGGSQNPPTADTAQPAVAATDSTGSSAPAATTAPANPGVDAMALIQEKLQGHHDLDRILNAKHTREEWNATLDRMIKYGANINEDEKKIIIDYLLSRQ